MIHKFCISIENKEEEIHWFPVSASTGSQSPPPLVPSLRLHSFPVSGWECICLRLCLMKASVRANTVTSNQEAEPPDSGSQAEPRNQNRCSTRGDMRLLTAYFLPLLPALTIGLSSKFFFGKQLFF